MTDNLLVRYGRCEPASRIVFSVTPGCLIRAATLVQYGFEISKTENVRDVAIRIQIEVGSIVEPPFASNRIVVAFPGVEYRLGISNYLVYMANAAFGLRIDAEFSSRSGDILPRTIVIRQSNSAPPLPTIESLLMRVMRDILHIWLTAHRWFLVHVSIAAMEENSVAFLGDKGCGKTAWLLKGLNAGWKYVCNDRAYLNPTGDRFLGFPIAAMVSDRSMVHISQELRERIRNGKNLRGQRENANEKHAMAPGELAGAYGTSMISCVKVGAIVLLEPETSDGFTYTKLNRSASVDSIIARNVFTPKDPTYRLGLLARKPPSAVSRAKGTRVLTSTSRLHALKFSWSWFDSHFANIGEPFA